VHATDGELWARYAQGDDSARERLISLYMPLARRVAAGLYARRATDQVEFGDYLQLAHVGLIEAVQRYRAHGDAQFASFATYRIRGSILNQIPKMTETGDRIAYLKSARRERVDSWLGGSADAPAPKPQGLDSLMDLVVGLALTLQLEEIAETHGEEPKVGADPYASRVYEDMQTRIRSVLRDLPERERQIVELHYFQQMGFDEVAATFGVTKGRISQLHRSALLRIRSALRERQLAEFC